MTFIEMLQSPVVASIIGSGVLSTVVMKLVDGWLARPAEQRKREEAMQSSLTTAERDFRATLMTQVEGLHLRLAEAQENARRARREAEEEHRKRSLVEDDLAALKRRFDADGGAKDG